MTNNAVEDAVEGIGRSPVNRKRFLLRLTVVASGGMFIDGYVLGIIGTVIGAITTDLNMSVYGTGLIGAAALIGIFAGGPLGGWLADEFGRKPMFALDLAVFVVGSILQFAVDSSWQLFLVRLLMGIAIGAEYSIGWPLMTEFAPARLRGRCMSFAEVAWYIGFVSAFIVGYVLALYDADWRIVLGTSTLPAVVLFLGRLGVPESPRWLMNKGRTEEAKRIADTYVEDGADHADIFSEEQRSGTFAMLFSPEVWRATTFISVFWFCTVTPYFAIATFSASVLSQYGLGEEGLLGAIGVNGVALAGVVVSCLLIDRIGRRKLTIPQQWVSAVVLVIIGFWASAPPLVVLSCFLVFAFANAMCTALTGVYPGEVLPTEVRGLGTGFATAVSRVGAGIGTFLFPWSMEELGGGTTMLVAAGICVVGAAASQVLAPETVGRTLNEISSSDKR
ncbi:putative MFS transporter [Saccharopolyspora lacisalsi]|uniref:Putative MFS transporter n=1 Tax=Halosaccharopolyspora lacisalsi TaxID=1000566 RepID=A0A839DSF2_9PSEU|nr:MFS transporter [Halosaccharopolyspora lacisalsi]MBA8824003.1 putative MFS transporter [Halosaccharopolyspora lacisalsi]